MITSVKQISAAVIAAGVASFLGLSRYNREPEMVPSLSPAIQASEQIPRSIAAEHRAINDDLLAATLKQSEVGKAARALAVVLESHFEREEEIALPPLSALPLLVRGGPIPKQAHLVAMADSLRTELPKMLEEHKAISAAVHRLERAAVAAGDVQAYGLAHRLQLHALNEEEVLYPAAVLVGEVIRARAAAAARPEH